MVVRDVRKGDYEAVDRLLLQLHEVDVKGRPELFVRTEHFMSRESFESLLEARGEGSGADGLEPQ